jgi:hypothetical protein
LLKKKKKKKKIILRFTIRIYIRIISRRTFWKALALEIIQSCLTRLTVIRRIITASTRRIARETGRFSCGFIGWNIKSLLWANILTWAIWMKNSSWNTSYTRRIRNTRFTKRVALLTSFRNQIKSILANKTSLIVLTLSATLRTVRACQFCGGVIQESSTWASDFKNC